MRLLFKLAASSSILVQPSLAANIPNVADEQAPRLHQRVRVFLFVEVVISMSFSDIDVKFMLSATILRTDIKTIEP